MIPLMTATCCNLVSCCWDQGSSCTQSQCEEKGVASSPAFPDPCPKDGSSRESLYILSPVLERLFLSYHKMMFPRAIRISLKLPDSASMLSWNLKELTYSKESLLAWKRGQSLKRVMGNLWSLSSGPGKLLETNLERNTELSGPPAEFPV